MSGMHNFMFGVFPILFLLVFALAFGMIIFQLVKGTKQWKKNNDSPRLTVEATVVAKRMGVSHYHNPGSRETSFGYHSSSATTYFVTFQVSSGDRFELNLQGSEYGLLVEGDRGNLTFQGTRFLSFQRF